MKAEKELPEVDQIPFSELPKGKRKKVVSLKDAFLKAFVDIGGVEGLSYWAYHHKNRARFYDMLTKMLPRDVNIGGDPKAPVLVVMSKGEKVKNDQGKT